MYDVLILGGGPAGLSAALYTTRANLSTAVADQGGGALARAEKIENYFGLEGPVSGAALLERTWANAERLGAARIPGEAVGLSHDGDAFDVRLSDGRALQCRALILATGRAQAAPRVPGLAALEGRGVSRCAVCDGFFFRGKAVGVLGAGPFARAEAAELAHLASSVVIYTDGETPRFEPLDGVRIDTRKIQSAAGTERLEGLVLADGEQTPLDGLFIALGSAGVFDFAARIGLATENNSVIADADGVTNVPGLFAAGDCAGPPYQVVVAAARGCAAALAAVRWLRETHK